MANTRPSERKKLSSRAHPQGPRDGRGGRLAWVAVIAAHSTIHHTGPTVNAGCIEIRYGIESGSARVLERIKKGFTPDEAMDTLSQAVGIFDRADAFYMWGFPFETMDDFSQTVFQMLSARAMGARILPSLLSLLPQTDLYQEYAGLGPLEFCPTLWRIGIVWCPFVKIPI